MKLPIYLLILVFLFFPTAKLQAICDNSTQRLNTLESEWAKVRDPIEAELQAKERRKAAVSFDLLQK
jgi:hypothetical protein